MPDSLFTSIITTIGTIGVVAILGKSWIEARLKSSIEHEYSKQIAIFQQELDQKNKVALVAELLAEYMKTPYGETISRDQRTVLNKLSLQATLWLPAELAIELSKRIQNRPDAKSPYDLILIARRQLINDTSISGEHVTIWDMTREKRSDPILAVPGKP